MVTDVDVRVHRDHVSLTITNPHPTHPCVVWIEGTSHGQRVTETIVCNPDDVDGYRFDQRLESDGEAWDFSYVQATARALRWGGEVVNDQHWVTAVDTGGMDHGPEGVAIAVSLAAGQLDVGLTIDVGVTPHGHTVRAYVLDGADEVASQESAHHRREASVSLRLPWLSGWDPRAVVAYDVCVDVVWHASSSWASFAPLAPFSRCQTLRWYRWPGTIAHRRMSVDAMVARGDFLYTLAGDVVTALDRHLQPVWTRTLDEDLSTACGVSANALVQTPDGVLAVMNRGACAAGPFGARKTWLMATLFTPTGLVAWRGDLGLPNQEAGPAMQIVRSGPSRFGLVTCNTTYWTSGECSAVDLDAASGRLARSECPLTVDGEDRVAFDPMTETMFVVSLYDGHGRRAGLHAIDCATGELRSRAVTYPYDRHYRFIQTTHAGATVLEASYPHGTVILSELGADAVVTEVARFGLGRSFRDDVSYVDFASRLGHVVCADTAGTTTCTVRIVPLDGSGVLERPFVGGRIFYGSDTSGSLVALGPSNATFVYGNGELARIGVTE